MKKALKVVFAMALSLFVLTLGVLAYCIIITKDIKLDKNKLVNLNQTITFYDTNSNVIYEESNGINITKSDTISQHTKNAFIAIEDKRFYSHNGIDFRALIRALMNNLKSSSYKEGGSTITQQLIKNTHLSSEKTLKRKIEEIKLALELEKEYSKDEIIEKYLNTIYFGDNCYGIKSASVHYFDKQPDQLNINESAMLAGIIKAPSSYSPYVNCTKCNERKNLVLKEMLDQGFIDKIEYNQYVNEDIVITKNESTRNQFDNIYFSKNELSKILEKLKFYPNDLNIYTTFDLDLQKLIQNTLLENTQFDKSCIIIDNNSNIKAYYSSCGETYRQLGSIIKPLLVYAPAIESNTVLSCTPILDEKTNINGYQPSNYNNKYNGYISVKQSLANSSNVCAVKLLNQIGIEKCKNYINKLNLNLNKNDNSLNLALGITSKGAKLSQIVNAYNIFLNGGSYLKAFSISKITTKNGDVVYQAPNNSEKIFSSETITIMNDMMRGVVENGTAKKLNNANCELCAKTGTVGNKQGNTDAYAISYNPNYVLGIWVGTNDYSYMNNNVTGGNLPSAYSLEIWDKINTQKKLGKSFNFHSNVKEVYIDKISYDEEHKVLLADIVAPERYKTSVLVKDFNQIKQKSTRFSLPIIEQPQISVKNNEIRIELCLTKYYNAIIKQEVNGKKKIVYDTINDTNDKFIYTNKKLNHNKVYRYYVTPYFECEGHRYYGNEIEMNPIKFTQERIDNWWKDDF